MTLGRWLASVRVAEDEQLTLDGALRQLDFLTAELAGVAVKKRRSRLSRHSSSA
jgi:hypothetical protein